MDSIPAQINIELLAVKIAAALTPPSENLLRLPAVEQRTGLKKSSIYSLVKTQSFPIPVRLNGSTGDQRMVAWVEGEISAWILAQIANRDVSQGEAQ